MAFLSTSDCKKATAADISRKFKLPLRCNKKSKAVKVYRSINTLNEKLTCAHESADI